MTMPILVGTDGHAQDVQVAGQPDRHHRPAAGDVRQDDGDPRRGDGGVLPAAARRASRRAPEQLAARRQARARARRSWRGCTRPSEAAGGRARTSTACSSQHEAPEEIAEATLRAPTTACVHLPGLIAEEFGISRSEARRLIDQGGVTLGERAARGRASTTSRRERADGQVLKVGRRRFRRLRAD